jgi:hypothetical protein
MKFAMYIFALCFSLTLSRKVHTRRNNGVESYKDFIQVKLESFDSQGSSEEVIDLGTVSLDRLNKARTIILHPKHGTSRVIRTMGGTVNCGYDIDTGLFAMSIRNQKKPITKFFRIYI